MTLLEKVSKELSKVNVSSEIIAARVKQVEALLEYEHETRGFDLWASYGKVRLYFTASGGNKNRKGFVDLVAGTIQADSSAMYNTVHKVNKEANFQVIK